MSSTRSDRGFRFPLDKYHDKIALHTNFKYLQEYLNYIRKKDRFAATVTVARRDSSKNWEGADHVADGNSDHTTLQAAIDSLPSAGGHIIILEGQYNHSGKVSLPAKKIMFSGTGTINFQGTESNNFRGFETVDGGEYIFTGLSFTGALRNQSFGVNGGEVFVGQGRTIVVDCFFDTLDVGVIHGEETSVQGRAWVASNNHYKDITLRTTPGAGNPDAGIAHGDADSYGVWANNNVSGLSIDDTEGGDFFVAACESGGQLLAIGNTVRSATGLDGAFNSNVSAAHNLYNGSFLAGDHSSVDHGTLSGLTDDDHTQYVLRNILTTQGDIFKRGSSVIERLAKGSDGQFLKSGASDLSWATLVEADISDLDHDDSDAIHDNVAGEISAITDKGTPVAGDHLLLEDSADGNSKKSLEFSSLEGALDLANFAGRDITDLSDVTISSISDDQILRYDSASGVFQNEDLPAAGNHDILSSTHGDTDSTDTPAEHEVLKWDDGNNQWIAASPSVFARHDYRGSAQTLSDSTNTTIIFDNIVFQENLAIGRSSGVYTVNKTGFWKVIAQVRFADNPNGLRQVFLVKNSSSELARQVHQPRFVRVQVVSPVLSLSSTDTIEVQAFQNSGGNLNTGSGQDDLWVSFEYLGP